MIQVMRTAGPTMSPFNAWVFLKGLETLRIRMEAHSAAALDLAHWLQRQPAVQTVFYPGLESHPQHDLAARHAGGRLVSTLEGGYAMSALGRSVVAHLNALIGKE